MWRRRNSEVMVFPIPTFPCSDALALQFPEDEDENEEEKIGNWRRRMGIEPTWDFVEPHAGFEDQERHQVA